jgi:hypothetical protein
MNLPRFSIRAFAVVCVAATSAYVMWLGNKINDTLSGPGWCLTAIGANRATPDSKIDVAQSCVGLLNIQLKSLATNSHILLGTVALCLAVLIIIVVAGARFSGEGFGAKVDVQPGDAVPVKVTNEPESPVPVAPTPEPSVGPSTPEVNP